eukprot:scaffold1243_cov173-Ochromonas_danica.AAC.22
MAWAAIQGGARHPPFLNLTNPQLNGCVLHSRCWSCLPWLWTNVKKHYSNYTIVCCRIRRQSGIYSRQSCTATADTLRFSQMYLWELCHGGGEDIVLFCNEGVGSARCLREGARDRRTRSKRGLSRHLSAITSQAGGRQVVTRCVLQVVTRYGTIAQQLELQYIRSNLRGWDGKIKTKQRRLFALINQGWEEL